MDGEVEPVPAQETDQHLAGCSACRDWQASALELSRTLRVREAVPVPDLTATILDRTLPPPAVRGWWPRLALIIVATAQVSLTLSQMLGGRRHRGAGRAQAARGRARVTADAAVEPAGRHRVA